MLIPPKYVPGCRVTVLLPLMSTAPQNVYVPALKIVAVFPLSVMLSPLPPFWYWPGLKVRLPLFPLKLTVFP